MYKVVAVAKSLEESGVTFIGERVYYVLTNDSEKYPWHTLVLETNGVLNNHSQKVIDCINDFKNQHKT